MPADPQPISIPQPRRTPPPQLTPGELSTLRFILRRRPDGWTPAPPWPPPDSPLEQLVAKGLLAKEMTGLIADASAGFRVAPRYVVPGDKRDLARRLVVAKEG